MEHLGMVPALTKGMKTGMVILKKTSYTTHTAVAFLLAFVFVYPATLNSTAAPAVRVAAQRLKPVTPKEIIQKWAEHYGVNTDLAVRIAQSESSLSCTVKNKLSS